MLNEPEYIMVVELCYDLVSCQSLQIMMVRAVHNGMTRSEMRLSRSAKQDNVG